MKMQDYDPGKLRYRVKFSRKVETQDPDSGAPVIVWQEYGSSRAAVNPMTGREFWAAQQQQAETGIDLVLRYRGDVNANDRAEFRGQLFDIKAVQNWQSLGHWLILRCQEGVNDG